MSAMDLFRILFLDIDGVLNSHQFFLMNPDIDKVPKRDADDEEELRFQTAYIDPYNVWNLKFVLENVPGLKVVVSSSRGRRAKEEIVVQSLVNHGLMKEVVLGCTPKKMSSQKMHEIGMWIHDSPEDFGRVVDDYVVVDDHRIFDDASPRRPKEYTISGFTGLTYPDACSIIRRFEPDWKQPVILL